MHPIKVNGGIYYKGTKTFVNSKYNKEVTIMPRFVKYMEGSTQFRIGTLIDTMGFLTPKEDMKLKKKAFERSAACDEIMELEEFGTVTKHTIKNREGQTFKMTAQEIVGGDGKKKIARHIDTGDVDIKDNIKGNIKYLEEAKKKYEKKPGHKLFNALNRIALTKQKNLLDGVGIDGTPGIPMYSGVTGMQKTTDVILNMGGEFTMGKDKTKWDLPSPEDVEKAADELGYSTLVEDLADVTDHNAEWAKEWAKDKPDIAKLTEIGKKYEQTMLKMEKDIKNFEIKFFEDMTLPENQRKINNIFSKGDIKDGEIIYDYRLGSGDGKRAINGPHWDSHKDSFYKEFEGQLTVAKLREANRTIKHDNESDLSKKVDDMIFCFDSLHHDMISEYTNEEKDRLKGLTLLVRAKMLQELEQQALKTPNDPYAKKVAEVAHEQLRQPGAVKGLTELENQTLTEKIDNSKLMVSPSKNKNIAAENVEDRMLDNARFDLKGLTEITENGVPDDSTPQKHFNWTKSMVTDELAKVLAVQTLIRSIKSQREALNDMAAENGGEGMTQDEIDEMAQEMLTDDNISSYAEEIKQGPEFNRMMAEVSDWKSLKEIEKDALEGNGMKLMNRMAQARKDIIREDTMQNKLDLAKQKQMQNEAPKLGQHMM